MSIELRHRSATGGDGNGDHGAGLDIGNNNNSNNCVSDVVADDDDDEDDDVFGVSSSEYGTQLQPSSVLRACPQYHGHVYKLRIPFIYNLLPTFVVRFLIRYCGGGRWIFSSLNWKSRYLVLLGSYLYKFNAINKTRTTKNNNNNVNDFDPGTTCTNIEEDSTFRMGNKLKGTPIPIDTVDVDVVFDRNVGDDEDIDDDDGDAMQLLLRHAIKRLPASKGHACIFSIRSWADIDNDGGQYQTYIATTNSEELQTWMNSLRDARHESIRRLMKHAPKDSYPIQWERYDMIGKSLHQRNTRISSKIQQSNMRQMDVTSTGPLPRGYYG